MMSKNIKKSIFKNPIFMFIVGALIFGCISGVLAYSYTAKQVTYTPKDNLWNVDNANDAIDSLRYNVTSMDSKYYSTEEKIVGRWTDGRPVYQITILGLNSKMNWVGTHAYTSCSITAPVANVEMVIDARAYMSSSSNGYINWSQIANVNTGSINSTSWTIACLEDYYLRGLTILYIKTTD